MYRTARLIGALRDRGRALVSSRGRALVSSRGRALVSSRGRALVFVGATAALAGAGVGSAVSGASAVGQQTALTGSPAPTTLAAQADSQTTAALGPAAGSSAQQPALGQSAADASSFALGQPYEIYDSVTPWAIPPGHEVATYADGPFAVSPSAVAGRQVLWIDTNGSDPQANAVDAEPGDVTPAGAASWAAQKLAADPGGQAIIYTMRSEWPAVQAAVRAGVPAAEQSQVRWWIADPTGVPHVVPGSSATQWYWGSSYDISTATPGF